MVNWTLFMVLILPPMMCLDREGTQEEIIRREQGALSVSCNDTMDNNTLDQRDKIRHSLEKNVTGTPEETIRRERGALSVCSNDMMDNIMLIICKIRTERRTGQNCSLLYQHGHEFENKCDSRFRLVKKSETVFIQWEDLTPEDHGNISCECSQWGGTFILQLSVRPDASENDSSEIPELFPLIGGASVIIITAAIFGLVYRRLRHRKQAELPPNMDPPDIDPYSTFIQRDSGLYSTVKLSIMNN